VARLAIFQPDARSGARLTAALAGAHELLQCDSWEQLTETMEQDAVEGCLLDADHPSLDEAIPRIELLRRRYPDHALIGFTEREQPVDYFRLGASGLESFVADTAGAMTTRSAVDEAVAICRGRIVTRALERYLASPAPAAIGWAVAHATFPVTVETLADALGTSLRALRDGLRAGGLPTPGLLMLWGRLVAAAARLQRDGRGVEETAFALGYASAPSLARATRTHVGATPVELAEEGPERVLRTFVERNTGAAARVTLGPCSHASSSPTGTAHP
jgi:AraC-like DNA-binding protein